MPVRQADQGQIVSFAGAECCEAIGSPSAQTDRLRLGSESFTDAIFPDAFSLRFEIELGHRYGVWERGRLLRADVHQGRWRNPQSDEVCKTPVVGLPSSHSRY